MINNLRGRGRRRRAHSLIELLVVISVSSVIGTAVVSLLGLLLAADRGGRRHLHESQSLARLARQFRVDVTAAEDASIGPTAANQDATTPAAAAVRLTLRLPAERTIVYQGEPGKAVRREEGYPNAVRHERYALPASVDLKFQIERGESPTPAVVSLKLESQGAAEAGRGARPGWRAAAILGRDRRLAEVVERSATPPADKEKQP